MLSKVLTYLAILVTTLYPQESKCDDIWLILEGDVRVTCNTCNTCNSYYDDLYASINYYVKFQMPPVAGIATL